MKVKHMKIKIVRGIIAIILVFGIYILANKLYIKYMTIDVQGNIISTANDIKYDDLTIAVDSRNFIVKSNGQFYLDGITRHSVLTISGDMLYQDITVKVDDDSDLRIFIDTSMEQFLITLGQSYKYRKFREIYKLLDEKYLENKTEDEFMSDENKYFDDLLKLNTDNLCTVDHVDFKNREYVNDHNINLDMIINLDNKCTPQKEYRKINIKLAKNVWTLNIL